MDGIKRCTLCNTPLQFSRMNRWNSDGTITQARNPGHRLFLYDAQGFDRLFDNVTGIIGAPVGHIVIESRRKATLDYLDTLMTGPMGLALRTFLRHRAYAMIPTVGALMGYGRLELRDFKRGEYIKVYGENIYCDTLLGADLVAIFNYLEGIPADIRIEDEGRGKLFTVSHGRMFGNEPASRFEYRKIPRKTGNLNVQRCPECELPIDFRKFAWSLDRGVITDRESGRDMVLVGANEIDTIFMGLEAQLDPEINRAAVEGQCRYVLEELTRRETSRGGDYLARQLALRGMGNLVGFELRKGGLKVEVENAGPYLMVAGLIKGIYETLTGGGSDCDYRLAGDGTLFIEVSEGRPAYVV
jgi:hypothetical protein